MDEPRTKETPTARKSPSNSTDNPSDPTHSQSGEKESMIANTNLKFVTRVPQKKRQKPFCSDVVQPAKAFFDLSQEHLFDDRPKTYLDCSFDKSFLEKSSEWRMFKDSHDNLEVGFVFSSLLTSAPCFGEGAALFPYMSGDGLPFFKKRFRKE